MSINETNEQSIGGASRVPPAPRQPGDGPTSGPKFSPSIEDVEGSSSSVPTRDAVEAVDEKPRHSDESDAFHPQPLDKENRVADGGADGVWEEEDGEGAPRPRPSRVQSRASSSRSRPVTIVSLSRRRGLFARLALIIPEVERPYDYTNRTKWLITTVVALAGSAAPLGSAIFYPALPQMVVDLKTSATIVNLTVAVYMLSMSIFPLWWSSFSETLGRRTIYVISFSLFVVFSVLSAISTNIAMLIVMRVLGGGASASVQAVGAGTIADIWEVRERGRAMGIFYLGPLMGPLLAPIIGGALSQRWGWQSTMWFLSVYGGLIFLMIVFCLPETLPRRSPPPPQAAASDDSDPAAAATTRPATLTRMLTRQSVSVHTRKTVRMFKRFFIDPLRVLLFLRFLPIAVTVFYAAITFGALFILNISIQSSFSQAPYSLPELIIGLFYIPSSLGYILASLIGGRWIDKIMAREARKAGRYDDKGKLVYLPEDRMRENAWLAAAMYPAAQIMFGWTVQKGVLWVAPAVASLLFGFGSMLIFGAATTMLTEFMPTRSSGGIAVNNFVRNIFSCVGTIVAQPLINVMGVGWLNTVAGLLTLVLGLLSVWSLGRFGTRWRSEMDRKLKAEGS